MRQLKVIQSITARDTASLEKYLTEVSKIALITAEEESKLASQTIKGDEAALVALTKANLRFVISVAKQYQYRGLPLVDLINEGNLGLMKAAKKFDETKGFKFISYAVWWIRQSIIQAINDKGRMVRLPSNRASLINRVNHCTSQLSQSLEREPHVSELASVLQVTSEEITALQGGLFHVSLDAPLSDENGSTMLEEMPATEGSAADNRVNAASLQLELKRCLAGLPLIQTQVVKMFFGIDGEEPMSLEMIGNDLGLSTERIRQLKNRALLNLGSGKNRLLLRGYLS